MSKVTIKGATTGTGTFTIESPATNTDRTLVLPDEAGTVLTNTSDIEAQVKTATNASGSAPIYACRAWVNFDGTTNPGTIRASGNVSSVTRNSTGIYTVNFTNAMPDTSYCVAAQSAGSSDSSSTISGISVRSPSSNGVGQISLTTSSVTLVQKNNNGTLSNTDHVSVAIYR